MRDSTTVKSSCQKYCLEKKDQMSWPNIVILSKAFTWFLCCLYILSLNLGFESNARKITFKILFWNRKEIVHIFLIFFFRFFVIIIVFIITWPGKTFQNFLIPYFMNFRLGSKYAHCIGKYWIFSGWNGINVLVGVKFDSVLSCSKFMA